MRLLGLLGAAGVLALAACGGQSSLNSSQVKAVALAYRYTPGSVRTYDFELVMDGKAGQAGFTEPIKENVKATAVYKVLSVDKAGTATVQITMTFHQLTMNGRTLGTLQKPQTFTIKIARNGSVVAGNGFSVSAGAGSLPGSDQLSSLLPDHAVKPGDTWDIAVNRPAPFGSGSLHFTAHNRFLRWETVQGHADAVVESKATIPADFSIDLSKLAQFVTTPGAAGLHGTLTYSGGMGMDTTTWLDESSGQLDRSADHVTMNITMTFPPGLGANPAGSKSELTGTFDLNLTAA